MSSEFSAQQTRELQLLEHNMQQVMMQHQALQIELNEIINALGELSKSSDDVYRVMGNIMMRAEKSSLQKELEERKSQLEIHVQAVEKQESLLQSKANALKARVSDGKNSIN